MELLIWNDASSAFSRQGLSGDSVILSIFARSLYIPTMTPTDRLGAEEDSPAAGGGELPADES